MTPRAAPAQLDRPVPYTLTPKAHAVLASPAASFPPPDPERPETWAFTAAEDPDRPVPFTLTAKAHAALDQDGI